MERTWKQVWDDDLVPYRELKNEVPFVMVAHVSYPKIVKAADAGIAVEAVD